MTKIITHRGLDLSKNNYFVESSLEAFTDQLDRGFGLEFDLQFTKDNSIVIIHDIDKIPVMEFSGCHLTTFANLLRLVEKKQAAGLVSAIHLKHGSQEKQYLDAILDHLKNADAGKFIIFDVKLETARYLKEKNPRLKLAPSVAHPYDIKRYNSAVGWTLLSIEETLANRKLFDWVWLDEWDLADENGEAKNLYNKKTFSVFRDAGLKIALVTPELHASSPGLLGGEAHPDAKNWETLKKRLAEIVALKPDAICTNYPDCVRDLEKSNKYGIE